MFSNIENMNFGWKKRLEGASTIVAMLDLHQVLRERAKRLKIGKSFWEVQGVTGVEQISKCLLVYSVSRKILILIKIALFCIFPDINCKFIF